MRPRVFIDGHVGTTGLRIRDWMAGREEVELLVLPEADRKDASARREAVLAADVSVLCLPEDAAREVAGWVEGSDARIVDASTAHRVARDFVFGLPELEPESRDAIRSAARISNPGCYATAFLLLVRPLVDAGLVPRETPLTIHALSGYTGGGRSKIERWEDPRRGLRSLSHEAPYALGSVHQHIAEMTRHAGLRHEPQFVPAVGPFRCGMRVQVPLHAELLPKGASGKAVWETLHERYRGESFVRVPSVTDPHVSDERSFDPQACNDTNRVELRVLPHPSGHVLLLATLDNLGKGACGTAIQCVNLMLGLDETAGLPA